MMFLSAKVQEISDLPLSYFREQIINAIVQHGHRLASLFVCRADHEQMKLVAVLVNDSVHSVSMMTCTVDNHYESFAKSCPEAHLFEREIWELWGIRPNGHPCLKPIRFYQQPGPYYSNRRLTPIGDMPFFQLEGEEHHEVGVGPVHAGVIEPGHFRFSCHGELVHHLEISLGYQHRGIEEKLLGGPDKKTLPYIETVAGDTTIAHSWAYCKNMEMLAGFEVEKRVQLLRCIMLELERMANHIGDLGALAGDVGFMPTQAYCGRIRGDFLNLSAFICGNRFGRSMLFPGGVHWDLPADKMSAFEQRLKDAFRDAKGAVDLIWENAGILSRFENTGIVTSKMAKDLGLVGVAAKASGLARDARHEGWGSDLYLNFKPNLENTGDVWARARVRWREMEQSYALINNGLQLLSQTPELHQKRTELSLPPFSAAVTLVEGWRGEVCHTVITGEDGKILFYKIVDPSFHNWIGLAMAMRNEEIYDFPLCNKSFNLSYCGHDL